MKQLNFQNIEKQRKEFGGSLLKSKRKSQRPLSTKDPIHFILRGDHRKIFPPGNHKLELSFEEITQKYGIRVFHKSFNWNHFHALYKFPLANLMFHLSASGLLSPPRTFAHEWWSQQNHFNSAHIPVSQVEAKTFKISKDITIKITERHGISHKRSLILLSKN